MVAISSGDSSRALSSRSRASATASWSSPSLASSHSCAASTTGSSNSAGCTSDSASGRANRLVAAGELMAPSVGGGESRGGSASRDSAGLRGDPPLLGGARGGGAPVASRPRVRAASGRFAVEVAGDGLAVDLGGPLPVGPVELGGVAVAAAAELAAGSVAGAHAARADEPGGDQSLGQPAQPALVGLELSRIRRQHEVRVPMTLHEMRQRRPGLYDDASHAVYPNSRQRCDLGFGTPLQWAITLT